MPQDSDAGGHSTSRTTGMLLAISLLLVMTQIPAGIFGIMNSSFVNKHFYDKCTPKPSELYQILASINSTGTFFIYYFMSSKFNATFKSIFNCWVFKFWEKS